MVDHHHLARALHDEGVKDILVTVIGDLTMVERDAFWGVMDNKRWVYPYDAKGERRHFKDLPKSVADLKDDPFRSLAGELRRVGGFAKDTTPFSEFLWADFLRRKMSRKSVEDDFEKAIEKALALAKSKDAIYLPGWCGPASDDLMRLGRRAYALSEVLRWMFLAAELVMQPALECAGRRISSVEGDRRGDRDNSPLPEAAGDADAGRQPGAGRAGQPANPEMTARRGR